MTTDIKTVIIHACPRSATKNLQQNFTSYLKATGQTVAGTATSLDDVLDIGNNEKDINHNVTKTLIGYDENGALWGNRPLPVHCKIELLHRFSLLMNSNDAWVSKRYNWLNNDPLLDISSNFIDKNVVVIRKDKFDHALSLSMARQLDLWWPSNDMTAAIEKYKESPFGIDLSIFIDEYIHIVRWNRLKYPDNFQIIYFDDMIKLDSAAEFCSFFNLEYIEFPFNKFEIEYGSNKTEMVANLEVIKKIVTVLNKHI